MPKDVVSDRLTGGQTDNMSFKALPAGIDYRVCVLYGIRKLPFGLVLRSIDNKVGLR